LAKISKDIVLVALLLYAGWLTKDNIYDAAYLDGYNAGGQAGYQQGVAAGRQLACMEKPI
jgi:hypothetical protein